VGDQGSTDYANIASFINDTITLDTTAPTITPQSPSAGGVTYTTTNLAIRAILSDTGSGIDTSAVTMIVDGSSVPPTQVTETLVRYLLPTASIGSHTVNITATDYAGYIQYRNWSFTVSSDSGTPGGSSPGGGGPVSTTILGSHIPITINTTDSITITAELSGFITDIESVDLFWNDGTDHSKPMTLHSGNTYIATIGPFPEGIEVTYYIIVLDSELQETSSNPYSFNIEDYNAPIISIISPGDGEIITDKTPTIKASYTDTGGINIDSVSLSLNDKEIISNATISKNDITYIPTNPLSYSKHKVTLLVADKSGNIATKDWSFIIQSEKFEIIESINELSEGESKTVYLEEYGMSVDRIKITAAKDLENVIINCKTMGEKPDNLTAPEDSIYMYLVIETNVEASDISLATIIFKVEKTWLDDNDIDKSRIKLVKYNDGWKEVSTNIITEDDTYVFYESTTPEFSNFAIVGATSSEETEFPLFYIIFIVTAIIVVVVILIKKGYIYLEEEDE
jgi:PGF-pre-PGF domain-containing protein